MTDKEYWLYISKVKGLLPARRKMLFEMLGTPEEVYKAREDVLRNIPLLEEFQIEQLIDFRKIDFEYESDQFRRKGIKFVTVDDKEFPERLRNIPDAPSFLFYRGELPDDNLPAVAVVGSRRCSFYGKEMCMRFSSALAQAGINIISGMASGVDGFAHRGAINVGGKTTAVLGCGVDVCYPAENRDIFEKLTSYVTSTNDIDIELNDITKSMKASYSVGAEQKYSDSSRSRKDLCKNYGGIVSEYYPGDKALPYNFPQRNRIISGLADILLVVEAGKKSGTFITVDHALEQGREIFAIPGRIGDTVSDGCNSLIKNGAGLAANPEDIIDELKSHYTMLLNAEKKRKKAAGDTLKGDEKKVYESLEQVPIQINEISERTGIDCGTLPMILVELELKGMIEEVGKNLYIKKR